MTINRNNFEAYLLDYLEGNLDPLLSADLMAFLAENPEFEKYLPDYDSNLSLAGSSEYSHKNILKKTFADVPAINAENFDEFCIAASEGILSDGEMTRLVKYISGDPHKQQNLDLFRKLKLQPDATEIFSGKSHLKKFPFRSNNFRYLYYTLGIAASLALIILLAVRKPVQNVYTDIHSGKLTDSGNTVQSPPVTSGEEVVPVNHDSARHAALQSRSNADNLPVAAVQFPLPEPEDPELNAIEPILNIQLASNTPTRGISGYLSQPGRYSGESSATDSSTAVSDNLFSETFFGTLISKVDFWKTAETAIQGFNYLTEAQLSIDKTTDESGKLTGLQVGMESYSISGNKIK